jgi:hypothetical protein
MSTGRNFIYLIAFIMSVVFINTDYSTADVLCKNNKRGILKLRPDECKKNETQVDLSDIGIDPALNPSRWSWLGEGGGHLLVCAGWKIIQIRHSIGGNLRHSSA